jgi:octaprenyl-diphosphate synthase
MEEIAIEAKKYIDECVKPELKDAFNAYLEYVIQRKL